MIISIPLIQSENVISKWQQPIGLLYISMWTWPLPNINTNIQNT